MSVLTNTDFAAFELMLEKEFQDVDHDRKLLARFDNIKQTKSVQEYVSAFRSLIMRMRHLVNDDQILYRFVKGLKPEV